MRFCSSNEPRHIVPCAGHGFSRKPRRLPANIGLLNSLWGREKLKFDHLRKTEDLAGTSRENQDGNTAFLKPNRNQGRRPGTPQGADQSIFLISKNGRDWIDTHEARWYCQRISLRPIQSDFSNIGATFPGDTDAESRVGREPTCSAYGGAIVPFVAGPTEQRRGKPLLFLFL